ncbi:uncharacterized protein LOC143024770 isoform X2 [Oratosquilla oratoria]|uniref:uncharacterized protein LOC143024770 isoform X2 n=1 Tax=Oratosquilla oratoria TaxID=337810 RepID=UPI003F75B920
MSLVVMGVVLIVLIVTGIFFNGYIIFLSCTQHFKQTRTATHLLLLHLGIVNVLLAAVFIASLFPAYFRDDWLDARVCGAYGCAWASLHVSAVWTVTALNVDKYVAIASPLHYAKFVSPTRAGFVLLVTWLLATGLGVLPLVSPGLQYGVRPGGCFPDSRSATSWLTWSYVVATSTLGCFVPALLITAANLRILVIARHHRHRIVSALWEVTVSAQATVTQQRSHFYLTRYRGRSAATTVLHMVGTFSLLYLPYTTCQVYEAATHTEVHPLVAATALALLSCAPTVNGFVYGVKSKVLRKNFKNFLRKQLYRSEVNYEIQARTPSVPNSRRPSVTPSITLPLQRQLQRRMSEILIQHDASSSGGGAGGGGGSGTAAANGGDNRAKLVRRSSDMCWRPTGNSGSGPSTPRGSSGTLRDFTPPSKKTTPPPLPPPPSSSAASVPTSMSEPMNGLATAGQAFQVQDTTSSIADTLSSASLAHLSGGPSLNSLTKAQPLSPLTKVSAAAAAAAAVTESVTTTSSPFSTSSSSHTYNRQSLRRALFARNKQKSLDMEMGSVTSRGTLLPREGPPRSVSHHHMEEPASPSLIRPLLFPKNGSEELESPLSPKPLSPARKSKRVSWSSDSFSAADDSPFESDSDLSNSFRQNMKMASEARRKRGIYRPNGLRFGFTKLSLERIDSEDARCSIDIADSQLGFDPASEVEEELLAPSTALQNSTGAPTGRILSGNGDDLRKSISDSATSESDDQKSPASLKEKVVEGEVLSEASYHSQVSRLIAGSIKPTPSFLSAIVRRRSLRQREVDSIPRCNSIPSPRSLKLRKFNNTLAASNARRLNKPPENYITQVTNEINSLIPDGVVTTVSTTVEISEKVAENNGQVVENSVQVVENNVQVVTMNQPSELVGAKTEAKTRPGKRVPPTQEKVKGKTKQKNSSVSARTRGRCYSNGTVHNSERFTE